MLNKLTDIIHNAALAHGCAHHAGTTPNDREEGGKTATKYSLRELTVVEGVRAVRAVIKTPFMGLKRLFDTTDDPIVRELLFNSVRVCTYCISDKYTTFSMCIYLTAANA